MFSKTLLSETNIFLTTAEVLPRGTLGQPPPDRKTSLFWLVFSLPFSDNQSFENDRPAKKYYIIKAQRERNTTPQNKNRSVMNNIAAINDTMSHHLDGEPHTPEKISFQYLKYSITDMSKQVERRKGARYTVSPFQLLINDGNYYLLAFDDYAQEMRTYRVDRMKDIRFTGEPRDGEEVFKQIDLKTYTKRVFSMYGGEQRLVEIRFINPLLDAVVDRFGTKDVQYAKVDDTHFSVTAKVEISDQFFGWILGFGKKAMLLYPDDVIDQFRAYMDKIREMY